MIDIVISDPPALRAVIQTRRIEATHVRVITAGRWYKKAATRSLGFGRWSRPAVFLHGMLDRRIERVEQALEGLRLQYPGYAEQMERRFIRRTALRLEEREYYALLEDGLIGEEVHSALNRDIVQRRDRAEASPTLDLTLQKFELVRQFPLFFDMNDAVLTRLARSLVTRYVNPDERILRRDSASRSVYFVASGAVELDVAGQTWRLGRGEMFGQMSILMGRPQRAEVRAIAPSTLLVLDETRFLRMLRRNKSIQAAVHESAEKRGIPTEQWFAGVLRPE